VFNKNQAVSSSFTAPSGKHEKKYIMHRNSTFFEGDPLNVNKQLKEARQEKKDMGPVTSCIVYSFCSVAMVLANKSLASSYETNSNFFLVLFQSLVAILCCEISKRCGWVKYPHFDIDTAIQWAPVNVLFCGMLFTGMGSLQHNSVPMVTVFKNVANIFTAIGDNIFFGNPVEPLVRASFAVMMCGAVAATYNDSSITTNGLIWMLMNCITTSGYCLYMKYATKTIKVSERESLLEDENTRDEEHEMATDIMATSTF
tara:strand:+ start:345 stop:1115 length:771 start_codon:yes stop_codon:yes gene_type:complete